MKTIRYPFVKKTRPTWVEVPFDATDEKAGTVEVSISDLPTEKHRSLVYQLNTATTTYLSVKASFEASLEAVSGVKPPNSEDLSEALVLVRSSDLGPRLKKLLTEYIQSLFLAKKDTDIFLSGLRSLASLGGEVGFATLAFAEALTESSEALARQKVAEEFEGRLSEGLAVLSRAREKIVSFGVTNHRGFLGQLTTDDGEPILDDDGKQQEQEIPFSKGRWSWNGKERPGVAPEGVDFYRAISPNGGLLVSLSEAVLIYQSGETPTPSFIWKQFSKEETQNLEKKSGPEKNDSKPTPGTHPDDDEASPLS